MKKNNLNGIISSLKGKPSKTEKDNPKIKDDAILINKIECFL